MSDKQKETNHMYSWKAFSCNIVYIVIMFETLNVWQYTKSCVASLIINIAKFVECWMPDWLDNLKTAISNHTACDNESLKFYCNSIKIGEANVWITKIEDRLCWTATS
jgi:hypothetical protein